MFHHRYRRGFTLIEVLLVMGILILLAGLLVPAVNKARAQATRVKVASDLQAISGALEAFKADHGDYPRVTGAAVAAKGGYDGAIALCQFLVAPAAADNLETNPAYPPTPGFRTRAGGKVYGPYMPAEQFKMEARGTPTDPAKPEPFFVLLDRFEQPILYFPASPAKPNVRLAPTAAAPTPPYVSDVTAPFPADTASLYDQRDNTALPLDKMQAVLGDVNRNGVINIGEDGVDKPFLLWSAGADEVFGPEFTASATDDDVRAAILRCDDVTNFR